MFQSHSTSFDDAVELPGEEVGGDELVVDEEMAAFGDEITAGACWDDSA